MLKFLFVFVLTSLTAHATTPMLEKYVSSGLTIPENSFVKDCDIYSSGTASISIRQNGRTQKYSRRVTRSNIVYIEALLYAAARGRIANLAVSCDGGSNIVMGNLRGRVITVDAKRDCESHRVNRSRATPELKRLAQRICGF